jgi:hypothetical protein
MHPVPLWLVGRRKHNSFIVSVHSVHFVHQVHTVPLQSPLSILTIPVGMHAQKRDTRHPTSEEDPP